MRPNHLPFETVTIGTLFSGGTLLGLIYYFLAKVGPWRKQTTDATDALIKQLTDNTLKLTERLDKLETTLAQERRAHYIEVRRIESRYQAQQSLDRHKFNNADATLDSLLRILELSPEKASEAARQAREARMKQRETEALEAAVIHKAEIQGVAEAEADFDRDLAQ